MLHPPHFRLLQLLLLLTLFNVSLFSAPVVNLKGSLSVNQGALNYSVALDLPKGVADVAPTISLDYNSNSGNGLLGQGWSIGGLSSVTRCGSNIADDGFNRAVQFDEKDNFCLDGQKLIPKSGKEFRTQIESYSKITYLGSRKSPTEFIVSLKSGDTYVYSIKNFGVSSANEEWVLTKIVDKYQNFIKFFYASDTLSYNSDFYSSNHYLRSITYANYSIDFTYDKSRKDYSVGHRRGASTLMRNKLTKVSVTNSRKELRNYKLNYFSQKNSQDKLKLKSLEKCVEDECAEPLQFSYNTTSTNAKFSSTYRFPNISGSKDSIKFLDLNNDGFVDMYEIKDNTNDVVWINNKNGGFTNHARVSIKEDKKKYSFSDLDSDGYIDIFVYNDSTSYTWLNNGKGSFIKGSSLNVKHKKKKAYLVDLDNDMNLDVLFTGESNPFITTWTNSVNGSFSKHSETRQIPYSSWLASFSAQGLNSYKPYVEGTVFTDINQDGKMDMLVNINNSISTLTRSTNGSLDFVFINNGNGFRYSHIIDYGLEFTNRFYHDMNGDNVIDIVDSEAGYVYLSNLSSKWNKVKLPFKTDTKKLKFIDINQDGYLDVLHLKNNTTDIYINKRGKFSLKRSFVLGISEEKEIKVGDFNADGFNDLYIVKNGRDDIWLNNGIDSFSLSSIHPDTQVTADYLKLVDINGDGMVDIIPLKSNHNIYISKAQTSVLKSITDSFENKTDIRYSLLTNKDNKVYTKHEIKRERQPIFCKPGANCPTIYKPLKKVYVQQPSLVVSSVSSPNGNGGDTKTSYKYEDLILDFKRGILGFSKIITKNEETDIKKEISYYQEFPLAGQINFSIKSIDDEKIFSSGRSISYIKKGKQYILNIDWDYSSDGLRDFSISNRYTYDEYGNVLKATTSTSEGYNAPFSRKITTNTYTNNTSKWILGRLKTSAVRHNSSGDSKTRKSAFTYNDKGSIASEIVEPGNSLALKTSYTYDSYGNIKTKTISGSSLSGTHVTRYTYSKDGRYLLKTTNPLNHSNKADNEYNDLGQLIQTTDTNRLTTNIEYDKWGKKIKELHPDGRRTSYSYKFDTSVNNSKYSITIKASGSPATITYYDNFDRVVSVKSQRFDGKTVYLDTYYNEHGEIEKKSLPYVSGETVVYVNYTYDEYGRLVETRKPSPSGGDAVERMEYNGLRVTTTDTLNHEKTVSKNALGQIIRIEEEEGTSVSYRYDAIGNLKETIPNGNESMKIVLNYDILGNKISMKDPDMGFWTYKYNALGQLISQTDAKRQTTIMEYDKLGRKTKETSKDGTSRWLYDIGAYAKGKLYYESLGNTSKTYTYDSQGRVYKVVTSSENKTFTQRYRYNGDGKLETTSQPGGVTLINTYNAQGFLESIKSPSEQIKDFDRDHFADLLEKTMASGLDYYKKSLEFSDKAKQLRAKADYYASIAKRYAKYKKRYHDYAQRLRSYAKRYEYYGKRYAGYSKRYRSYANYYYNRANYYYSRYGRYWWGRWVGSWFTRIANRYSYYSSRYAYYSRYYLNRAKNYNHWADRYDYYGSYFGRVEDYYLKKSNELYAEANALEVKAKEYKRLATQNKLGADSEQVSQAYKEILGDANHVYHYKVLSQNSLGKVTKYLSGNGLVTNDVYNQAGAMTQSKTGYTFDGGIRDLRYEYDHNYNVKLREDKKLNITQQFGYDKLDRISWTKVNSNKYGFAVNNYQYDVYGNLKHKDGKTLNYHNNTHKVKSVGSTKYYYDANGNMNRKGNSNITYNAHNKVTKLRENGKNITFTYDMNQKRYKKSEGLKDTYYLNKTFEYQTHTNGSKAYKYMIYANGKVVAVHSKKIEVQSTGEKFIYDETRYLHYDSLGSVDSITNQRGTVVQRTAYEPFGEQLEIKKLDESKQVTNRGYTGHEHIEGTKIIHMNARLYDSSIGRFLSADTIIQAPFNSQSFNRYSYVINNPLKYIDPTGHQYYGTVGITAGGDYGSAGGGYSGGGYIGAPYITAFNYSSPVAIGAGGSTILNGSTQTIGVNSQMSFATQYFSNTLFARIQKEQFNTGNYYRNVAKNAIISGTVSSITGGKFANGASMGAFRYMFNDALHERFSVKKTYGGKIGKYRVSASRTGATAYGQIDEEFRAKLKYQADQRTLYSELKQWGPHRPTSFEYMAHYYGDEVGFALSVGSLMPNQYGMLMGATALMIDVEQGDTWGVVFGVAGMFGGITGKAADIGYGGCRLNNECSDAFDRAVGNLNF